MTRRTSRAGVLLLLCLFSLYGLTHALRDMESNAERFGAMCVPLGLYAAGAWYAYKDGSRTARIGAGVLGLMMLTGVSFGVVTGLRRAAGNAQVDRELAAIRSELARDLSPAGDDRAALQRYSKRMDEAVVRFADSESPDAAAIGRFLQHAGELRVPIEARLNAAIETASSSRFLDVRAMLASGDFEWQKQTAHEYEDSAHAAFKFYGKLPQLLNAEIERSGLSQPAIDSMRAGMERTRELTIRTCQAHGRTASEYTKLIEYLNAHGADAEIAEDGTIAFSTTELAVGYEECWQRIADAEKQLDLAISALKTAMTQ
ncbi:MAG: hypothetical protein IT453_17400 [Planctomycetes bacterium]|nr:hypothetical protein [Planctomycetota bacterium]